MAYIGQSIKNGTFSVLDTSGNTYNGSNTTFSLGTQVGSAAQLLVSHDGVIQKPGTDYTLATGGTQITFTTAPASGASIFIVEISGAVGGTITPSDNSVGVDQLNLSDEISKISKEITQMEQMIKLRKEMNNIPKPTINRAKENGLSLEFTKEKLANGKILKDL